MGVQAGHEIVAKDQATLGEMTMLSRSRPPPDSDGVWYQPRWSSTDLVSTQHSQPWSSIR